MSIGIVTTSDEFMNLATAELQSCELDGERVEPGARLGAGRVLVVDGIEAAELTQEANTRAHLVVVLPRGELSRVNGRYADIALTPLAPKELGYRVQALIERLSRDEDLEAHLLAAAVEQAGDVIEISDPKAVLQYVNPAFRRILGYRKEEVLGKTPAQLIRSDRHSPEHFQNIDRTLNARKVWSGLLISKAKDGRVVHMEATISPITNAKGEITHHVSVKRDITERVKREQALQETNRALAQARDAALSASKSKSEFLANMSHELRTPLNAIIGYSELLMEDAEDDSNTALYADLSKIRDAGAHLLDLINDVLDISKVEAGKMELQVEEFDLTEVLSGVHSTILPLAEKKKNTFTLEWQSAPPTAPLRTDRRKLKQILMNLLSNALRFTENGNVWLRASLQSRGGEAMLRLQVVDTGIGISKEQQEKIFRPFTQADSSTTRKYGGTGLGLTISRAFCEMMGGTIALESESGRGATFTIELPCSLSEPAPPSSARSPSTRKILIIDDDPAACDLLSRSLLQHGYQVHIAPNGQRGLAKAREIRPHLVILDVIMPDIDGWSVLTALKLDVETENIPVVILSGHEQSEVGLTLGAVDYFVKPVEPRKLLTAIRRHVANHGDPLSVLVVEDDAPTRELIQRTLEGAGHSVDTAENGRVALEMLDLLPNLSLIVLDLMMPELDGFQFLEQLRLSPSHNSVPVVVATAKVLTERERRSLQNTTQRIIEKNAYSRTELLRIVEKQVTRLLSIPPPPAAAAPSPSAPPPSGK